jgi:hypothetical protein
MLLDEDPVNLIGTEKVRRKRCIRAQDTDRGLRRRMHGKIRCRRIGIGNVENVGFKVVIMRIQKRNVRKLFFDFEIRIISQQIPSGIMEEQR